MDVLDTARAYRRRADAREADRVERLAALRQRACQLAALLREAFGPRVRIYLFGSAVDLDRFRPGSDLDLAVAGLEPAEYWEAWRIIEALEVGTRVDLVRFESAAESLRETVRLEGEELV